MLLLQNVDAVVAGTAGLGHVDSFIGLHKVCRENDVWLHVLG